MVMSVFYSSNLNSRGLITNALFPTSNSQQDTISQTDSGFEQSNSPSVTLKQRAMKNNRSLTNPTILHSNSNNSINNTPDSVDASSGMKPSRSLFESIPDLPNEKNGYSPDDLQQYDRASSTDDRQSISSPEKRRKQLLSTKIFKPFQNMRFRKKTSTS